MFRHQPKPFLTLAFACSLLLGGCETPAANAKAKKDPVPLQHAIEDKAVLPLAADADKISKLEQQIAALEKEVAGNRPKIAKIDVMEQKFKDLSLGLDRIDATYNMKPAQPVAPPVVEKPLTPVEVAPPPKPVAPPAPVAANLAAETKKAEAPKPPVSSGKKTVEDLRIGEKKEYSRLVLDLGQSVKVNYDIDNEEKILLVEIPGFKWDAAKTKTFPKSMLISSYQAETDEKGSRLVVQLRGPAKVANYSNIEATGGKMPRAVLDIAPQ